MTQPLCRLVHGDEGQDLIEYAVVEHRHILTSAHPARQHVAGAIISRYVNTVDVVRVVDVSLEIDFIALRGHPALACFDVRPLDTHDGQHRARKNFVGRRELSQI